MTYHITCVNKHIISFATTGEINNCFWITSDGNVAFIAKNVFQNEKMRSDMSRPLTCKQTLPITYLPVYWLSGKIYRNVRHNLKSCALSRSYNGICCKWNNGNCSRIIRIQEIPWQLRNVNTVLVSILKSISIAAAAQMWQWTPFVVN